ncbi:hypothetical protein XM38_031800 [Halomicronema hongdechloris C2206]|uniref:Uncharacterized protein n=1 Tax=Halomicronema hongdechloris C2206 TaxID=1641165 RepID=A0A1Z3HPK4_9CYAN|nr:hypothetical protein [Halomicronema hongdechloris]ASC72225.1 hypothetical protein XM38_031800 [Halomicronema hongdechloris C2206]
MALDHGAMAEYFQEFKSTSSALQVALAGQLSLDGSDPSTAQAQKAD